MEATPKYCTHCNHEIKVWPHTRCRNVWCERYGKPQTDGNTAIEYGYAAMLGSIWAYTKFDDGHSSYRPRSKAAIALANKGGSRKWLRATP